MSEPADADPATPDSGAEAAAGAVPGAVPTEGDREGADGGTDARPANAGAPPVNSNWARPKPSAVPTPNPVPTAPDSVAPVSDFVSAGSKGFAQGDTAAWGRPSHTAHPGAVPAVDPGTYWDAAAAAPGWRIPVAGEMGAAPGASWGMSGTEALLYPRRVPPVQRPPRSAVIPMPRGTFTAIAGAGVAAAVCVPLDRPGIGWLFAVLASGGAVYAVDRRARREAAAEEASPDARESVSNTASEARAAVPDSSADPTGASGGATNAAAVDPTGASGGAANTAAPQQNSGHASSGASRESVGDAANRGVSQENPGVSHGDSPQPAGIWSRMPVIGGWPADRVLRSARMWWVLLAVLLVAVGTFRAANWLFVLCLLGAAMAASLAVVGRRTAYGTIFDVLAVPYGALTALPWLYRWAGRRESARRAGSRRAGWSVLVTLGLLVVFVPLLAGADAVFARLVSGLIPSLDPADVWSWGFLFVLAGLGVAGALYLLAGPPPAARGDSVAGEVLDDLLSGPDTVGAQGVRRFSKAEWGLPLGALTVLFAVFVGTQLAVLFGGDGYVQRTADLTYAEYARNGFWQLSIVSLLTLGVIAIVQRTAAQRTPSDRLWLRVAVSAVSVLTMVIVASALHRMWTYQQAYGFTVLRVLVEVFELWIALIYILVLASLVRLSREWVPRAAIGAAALTLLALAVVNPERFIADRNIDRWESSHRLDSGYLSGLSADALPAVDRLPAAQRDKIADAIRSGIDNDSWRGWNLSRARAR
ncbi:DUF4153 domain-containing protein [Nocardia sp. NPDC052001]|uniref:DUF4153 domain-containing protein n=1 Tax=Nocardia sp. NPDC052001 TaxID=3154853 RepID=UPI00343F8BF0